MPGPRLLEDVAFDAVYPMGIQLVSRRFWTPVAVAHRAAELLRRAGARRVLDVGAGVGKFVLAAASVAPEIAFVGVEQRPHLVTVARSACRRLRIANAHFQVADVTAMPWDPFDAFYFFNSLAENLFCEENRLDDRVELSLERLARDSLRVEQALRVARVGCLVVTYHGASVRLPACYELEASEPAGTDTLRLWRKVRETDDGAFYIELDDEVVFQRPIAEGLAC